jgi:ribosomal protein S24E
MSKIKSHKTVEQIAKKHWMDVSFIQKQLDMGEPIEHEHTQNHDLARDIALQHLDEIPDYYTRLKKMEADAKKHHKKFKDVTEEGLRDWFGKSKSKDKKPGWVNVLTGGTCASDEPGEGVPKCVSSEKRKSMTAAERRSAARRKKAADPGQQEKTGAAEPTYVSTDLPKKKMKEEMDVQEAKDKPGKGSGKKDACYHKVKSRYDVWPSAYASGALVKCRRVGAANWGTKSEEVEEQRYCPLCDKRETRSECSYGEKAWDKVSVKDEEYSMARSELKTIVGAVKRLQAKVGKGEGDLEAWVQSKITKAADYIDTAADYVNSGEMEEQKLVDKIMDEMKCWPGYKKKGTQKLFGKKYNRCVKAENVTIEDADGNTFAEVVDLITPDPIKGFKSQVDEATRLQAQTGNVIAVTLMWRGKYYSLRMFFPQIKTPSRQEINDELQKVYPGSKVVYHSVSEFTSGEPIIQACGPQGGSSAKPGPSRAYVKPYGEQVELGEGEAWQNKEGKNPKGGLNEKGRKSYERVNPGSDLKPPSKEVGNPRRKSFCARMSGMKKKLTSAKTANDPNSRINKSLRAWNC